MNTSYINQSTVNITRLLRIMELNEENINTIIGRQNTTLTSLESHLSNLMSNNNEHLINYILNNNNNLHMCKFEELVNPICNICPITQQIFNNNDLIIKINLCGHIFKKDEFIIWINQSSLCPCCRVNFLTS